MTTEGNGHKDIEAAEKIEEMYKQILGPLYTDGGIVVQTKCPNCGSEDRIMESIYQYLVSKKKMSPGGTASSSSNNVTFLDQSKPNLVGSKAFNVTVHRDICRGCGREYPVAIVRNDGTITNSNPNGGPQIGG